MTKHPLYNAAAAIVYVVLVVGIIQLLSHFLGNKPDNTFLAPLFALSLLTLSVSVMGYIFFYQPVLMLLKGEQKEGVQLFLKTVGIFAGFTALVLITLFVITLTH